MPSQKLTPIQLAKGNCRIALECSHEMYPNRHGHYLFKKVADGIPYRIKFQKHTMRLERQTTYGTWFKVKTISYLEGIDQFLGHLKGAI